MLNFILWIGVSIILDNHQLVLFQVEGLIILRYLYLLLKLNL
jgi:hypothetical protein